VDQAIGGTPDAPPALVLSLGLVADNLLRLCGQAALEEDEGLPPTEKMPLAKSVFRRRLRSVIQDLMYFVARLTWHARRWGLSLWRENPWRFVWQRFYHHNATPPEPSAASIR
jgi:hypothetical protein